MVFCRTPIDIAALGWSPIGGEEGHKSIKIVIHYNNPLPGSEIQGVSGSSDAILYFTRNFRPNDLGVLAFGDPLIRFEGTLVGEGQTEHTFDYPSACSSLVLHANEEVTVIRETFHMHSNGVRATSEHICDGEVIREGSVAFFDYSAQGNLDI